MKKRIKRWGIWLLALCLIAAIYVVTGFIRSLYLESSIQSLVFSGTGQSGIVRIVQLSDLHRAEFGEDNQDLIDLVASKKPDLIVTTGDMIDIRTQDISDCIDLYRRLCRIAPVYYSLGNHEIDRSDLRHLLSSLRSAGVHVLDQRTEDIYANGLSFRIGGCYRADGLPYLLEEGPVDILLCHFPQDLDWYAAYDIPLTFSGHTHGGQFRIPLADIALYAPGQGWFPEYTTGLYQQGSSAMIVSRGLGNSSFPFRVHNPPEIVVVDLLFTP